jgi:hypothetical protein
MAKKPAKPKGSSKNQKTTKTPKPYQSPTVSDEEVLDFSDNPTIPTPIRLNN